MSAVGPAAGTVRGVNHAPPLLTLLAGHSGPLPSPLWPALCTYLRAEPEETVLRKTLLGRSDLTLGQAREVYGSFAGNDVVQTALFIDHPEHTAAQVHELIAGAEPEAVRALAAHTSNPATLSEICRNPVLRSAVYAATNRACPEQDVLRVMARMYDEVRTTGTVYGHELVRILAHHPGDEFVLAAAAAAPHWQILPILLEHGLLSEAGARALAEAFTHACLGAEEPGAMANLFVHANAWVTATDTGGAPFLFAAADTVCRVLGSMPLTGTDVGNYRSLGDSLDQYRRARGKAQVAMGDLVAALPQTADAAGIADLTAQVSAVLGQRAEAWRMLTVLAQDFNGTLAEMLKVCAAVTTTSAGPARSHSTSVPA